MKVKELIEQLSKCDPEKDVLLEFEIENGRSWMKGIDYNGCGVNDYGDEEGEDNSRYGNEEMYNEETERWEVKGEFYLKNVVVLNGFGDSYCYE